MKPLELKWKEKIIMSSKGVGGKGGGGGSGEK
jgi:hypothetical protein